MIKPTYATATLTRLAVLAVKTQQFFSNEAKAILKTKRKMELTHEQELEINGSGLFFFQTDLEANKQLEILNWHNSLTKQQKEFVRILRHEASEEAEFFAQGD